MPKLNTQKKRRKSTCVPPPASLPGAGWRGKKTPKLGISEIPAPKRRNNFWPCAPPPWGGQISQAGTPRNGVGLALKSSLIQKRAAMSKVPERYLPTPNHRAEIWVHFPIHSQRLTWFTPTWAAQRPNAFSSPPPLTPPLTCPPSLTPSPTPRRAPHCRSPARQAGPLGRSPRGGSHCSPDLCPALCRPLAGLGSAVFFWTKKKHTDDGRRWPRAFGLRAYGGDTDILRAGGSRSERFFFCGASLRSQTGQKNPDRSSDVPPPPPLGHQ